MKKTVESTAKLALLNAAAFVGFMGMPAMAQDTSADDEIVVTGFRASLQSSTNAKRDAVGFTDSVFAEDIGQFPDLNIAESLNRIPGIQISREVNGEGLNVQIRGLGTNFVKVLLNDTQIAVASTGAFDSQKVNREVDLDLFPTELFTRLDVNKSPQAHILEGGVSGTINLRAARPFDNPGTHLTYVAQESYGSLGETWSPRGALIGSWTNDRFGVLVGVSAVHNNYASQGYETIGYTTPDLSAAQCNGVSDAPCDANQGNGFTIPGTVPAGLAGAGSTVDAAYLLAQNPGLTIEQIGAATLPRLGRPAYFDGTRDRVASLISLQFRPMDGIDLYLDMMGALADRDTNRRDIMFEVRNSNFMIPTALQVDENNAVTGGRFNNARWFLEARPYQEDLEFYNINPGATLQLADDLRVDLQANYSHSVFYREQPTIGLTSPLGAGVYIDYTNTGEIPTFGSNFDINDPNAGWVYLRLNLQAEKRVTYTQGMHWDLTWGDDRNNLRFGVAYDEAGRRIMGLNNDAAWEDFTCRGGGDPDGAGPAPRPGCNGGAGSAVPQSTLGQYLMPGAGGFVDVDYSSFFTASDYERFANGAPAAGGAATGANSGLVQEETIGAYIEGNGEAEWGDRLIRFNAGARWLTTDQIIASYAQQSGGTSSVREFTDRTDASYDAILPSMSVVADIFEDVTLRFSGSRTLTRQNPNAMLPNTSFSDPSAQQASQGNPNLTPFFSNNFDFGGEWYTGGEGYVGFTLFNKQLTGFTQTGTNTVPFSSLNIPFENLSETQQIAINNRGGPNVATVTISQQVNAGGVLTLNGVELTWVQPLDFVLEGLGFTANYTRVNQSGSGSGAPVNATGVPRYTYNVTGYYERGPFSGRLSYNYNDVSAQNSVTGPQDGFPYPANPQPGYRFNEARGQLDAAFRLTLENLPFAAADAGCDQHHGRVAPGLARLRKSNLYVLRSGLLDPGRRARHVLTSSSPLKQRRVLTDAPLFLCRWTSSRRVFA